MAKSNEQLEDILDDLSVIKSSNATTEQRLSEIEALLEKLTTKEGVAPTIATPTVSISYDEIKDAVRDGMTSSNTEMPKSAELLSDKAIMRMGNTFINLYAGEIKKLRIVINVLKSVNILTGSHFIGTFARKYSCY